MFKNFLLSIFTLLIITSCNPDPCNGLYLRKPNPYIDEVRTYVRTSDGDRETDVFYTGRCINYNAEGVLLSIQRYQDGLDHGKWKFFYEDGTIETVGKFKMGKRVGKWKYYHPNGNLKQVSSYKSGLRYGAWTGYNSEGDVIWEEVYSEEGVLDSLQ
tara:strand:+ start:1085 stop:1555 length:471 start_codon:yes stop_codon:yes gene_type:complete